jgi:hypothetical protein
MKNISSRASFAAHSGHPKRPEPSPLMQYIKKGSDCKEIRAYVQSMDAWKAEIPIISNLSKTLPDDTFENLWMFTTLFTAALPKLSSICEGLSRRHPKVYKEFADLLGLGVKFNAYGLIRQQRHEVATCRYVQATTSITDILSYPTPADRDDTRLPPRHIDEGSYLEGVLSDSLKDISQIIFLQMRIDGRNDQVDFLVERATHILAKDTRYMDAARDGMENAFYSVYHIMTDTEKAMVPKSRFTVGCPTSTDTVCKLMRDILIANTKGYEMNKRGRPFE